MSIQEFSQKLLLADTAAKRKIFVKNDMLNGTPFVFKDRENDYLAFRNLIANHFGCPYMSISIVGSAKLGFSFIKGTQFSLNSDIDTAISNIELFDEYSKHICEFQYYLDSGLGNFTDNEIKKYHKFLEYYAKGWIRPDMLPTRIQIQTLRSDWADFFDSISHGRSGVGNYKVKAGLYKSDQYLERYHLEGIEKYYNALTIKE
jgi:hypothetical protein